MLPKSRDFLCSFKILLCFCISSVGAEAANKNMELYLDESAVITGAVTSAAYQILFMHP